MRTSSRLGGRARCPQRVGALVCAILLTTLILLTGCASHYRITLNGGTQIETTGKPRLEHGYYYYTDSSGRKVSVPAGRVQEVAPASMTKDQSATFKTPPVKR
jgi:hypothetical protein